MSDQISISLGNDPQVKDAFERFKAIVPEAEISHIVRAALLAMSESESDHQIEVYIREQIAFDQR